MPGIHWLVIFSLIAPRNGLRVGNDGPIDLDPVAGLQRGIELDQAPENADLLRLEVDMRKLPEDTRTLDSSGTSILTQTC